jgi:transposase
VHRDLRRPNVTLALLWEEYRAATTDGFGYSWFCDLYREWAGRLKPTLRQVHIAGDRLFVDFAGHTMEVIDAATGEVQRAEIFVAVLGASSFIYAEATASQALADWIGAHVNALTALGGVPQQIVYDYVPGHVIVVMCRPLLCGRLPKKLGVSLATGHISTSDLHAVRAKEDHTGI